MALTACSCSGADDPNPILTPIGVRYKHDSLPYGRSDGQESTFFDGMVGIVERQRERIWRTVTASSNDSPCLRKFRAALFASHS